MPTLTLLILPTGAGCLSSGEQMGGTVVEHSLVLQSDKRSHVVGVELFSLQSDERSHEVGVKTDDSFGVSVERGIVASFVFSLISFSNI